MMRLPTVLALLSIAACATSASNEGRPEDDAQPDWRTGGKGDGDTCDFATMTTAQFYDLFAYKPLNPEAAYPSYTIGTTFDSSVQLTNGDSIDLRLYLLADYRVIAEYSEQHRIDASSSEVVNQTVIVTRASVDPTTHEVTIAGVGHGTPSVAYHGTQCAPSLAFEFTADQRSPGLTGRETAIYNGSTSRFVIDPDHLDQVPSADARRWFQEDVADGTILVRRY